MDWEERVLPSIGNEVVKSVVAQYNAEQLLTQREKVSGMFSICGYGSAAAVHLGSCLLHAFAAVASGAFF
jgi:hypothetical protein